MTLAKRPSDLVELARTVDHAPAPPYSGQKQDTTILVVLGPDQNPGRIAISRNAWPTCTALNQVSRYGKEFHMRLRRHTRTGIYLVYGSVTLPDYTVRQRGHLCRTLEEVAEMLPLLRAELEIPTKKALP